MSVSETFAAVVQSDVCVPELTSWSARRAVSRTFWSEAALICHSWIMLYLMKLIECSTWASLTMSIPSSRTDILVVTVLIVLILLWAVND